VSRALRGLFGVCTTHAPVLIRLPLFAYVQTFSKPLVTVKRTAPICGKLANRKRVCAIERYGHRVRWEELFADLEGELAAAEVAQRQAEVAERTRVELGQVGWVDRLAASRGPVRLELLGGVAVEGEATVVGDGWAVLTARPTAPRVVLVRLDAAVSVEGVARGARAAGRAEVTRRLSFAAALRRVARDRSVVALTLVDGRRLVGTLDAVFADHAELAEHPADEPRRPRGVSRVLTVPLASLASVAPVAPSSWE
jgi:hypothetical protein